MTLFDRYLVGQLARPMVVILLAALVALLAERTLRVVDIVVGWRGSLVVIFEMLGYLVPHYVGLALPAALFIAILITVSRLSRDGELDAIMASGAGFWAVLRPLLVTALIVAGLNAAVQSHLQPWSRYAYRAAVFTLSNVSFQMLLKPNQFATLGDTTYAVDTLSPDNDRFTSLFLVTQRPDGGLLTVTAERGNVVPAAAGQPTALRLENGVQQLTPPLERPEAQTTTVRFRGFTTDLRGNEPTAFRARGEDEREYTVPELVVGTPDPLKGIEQRELDAELHVRLVRIAATVILPLIAAPLAIARRRTRRSYGFLIGVSLLLVFNQVLQFGKTIADDGKVSVWLGLWGPFVVFAALGLTLSFWKATRVPSGSGVTPLERALERAGSRLVAHLPRWRAAT